MTNDAEQIICFSFILDFLLQVSSLHYLASWPRNLPGSFISILNFGPSAESRRMFSADSHVSLCWRAIYDSGRKCMVVIQWQGKKSKIGGEGRVSTNARGASIPCRISAMAAARTSRGWTLRGIGLRCPTLERPGWGYRNMLAALHRGSSGPERRV